MSHLLETRHPKTAKRWSRFVLALSLAVLGFVLTGFMSLSTPAFAQGSKASGAQAREAQSGSVSAASQQAQLDSDLLVLKTPKVRQGQQNLAIYLFKDASEQVSQAKLSYRNLSSDVTVELSAQSSQPGALVFVLPSQVAGQFQIDSLSYTVAGKKVTRSFVASADHGEAKAPRITVEAKTLARGASSAGLSASSLNLLARQSSSSVKEQSESQPSAQNAQVQTNYLFANGKGSVEETPSAARAFSTAAQEAHVSSSRTGVAPYTVCLDPGHGGGDSGGLGNGLVEKYLTLKIAFAARDVLQAAGVNVVMTRTNDTRPSEVTTLDLKRRVEIAQAAHAIVFVSIHSNVDSSGGQAQGVEVWYPNASSFSPHAAIVGHELAEKVEARLIKLGLADRGVKTRDWPIDDDTQYYPDGHAADYYGVIRHARWIDMPAIIIEHGFMTSTHDANLLKHDWFLKELGQQDALAILDQFGTPYGGRWTHKNGKIYYTDADGKINPGWLKLGSTYYYQNPDGSLWTGWKTYKGRSYWFDPSTGALQTGWIRTSGVWYYANPKPGSTQGALEEGWQNIAGKWYHFRGNGSGAMQTGWFYENGKVYWLSPSTGALQTGWIHTGGVWYYADPRPGSNQGALEFGWVNDRGTWYHMRGNGSGAMQTGWFYENGKVYWLSPSTGALQTGWIYTGGVWYYADPHPGSSQGSLQYGWINDHGTWYYLRGNGSGAMKVGWLYENGKVYWLSPSTGALQTGWIYTGGVWYYADPHTGALQYGWINYKGDWYYLREGGSGAMQTGWLYQNGKYYWLRRNGALQHGWIYLSGHWYFANPHPDGGALWYGWLYLNSGIYYLNPQGGSMVTGMYNGYYFDENGRLV